MKRILMLCIVLTVLSTNTMAQTSSSDEMVQSSSTDSGKFATIHFYRPKNAVGGLVGYNIYLDSTVLVKLKNNAKHSIKVYKEGKVAIWPHTQTKKLHMHIKFGEEYYIKFALVSGLVGAHPELNLINPEQGNLEFTSMEGRKVRN